LFAESNEENTTSSNPHVSLILHESLLNDFFSNIGEIKGKNSSSVIDYEWTLLNPRIEILEGEALFFAEINAKTDLFSITRDVHGIVKVEYIEKDNIIEVSISKADVMLDVNLFGNNILLGEIDIAKYFTKSFTFEGIKPFNNDIDFNLPNSKQRKIKVKNKNYQLSLLEDMIKLDAEFIFEKIE
tara:strand:- start:82 stop:636 length:555 start_codon:yes stop_codon:yes gene_type:complete